METEYKNKEEYWYVETKSEEGYSGGLLSEVKVINENQVSPDNRSGTAGNPK